jgi:Fe-Mn family superoxide dismutase
MSRYQLPELDYDYGELEPILSGQIMELHHQKHHAAYVKKANETIDQLEEARKQTDPAKLAGLERALAFNLSGHILHSIFWKNLSPNGGGRPDGELLKAIQRDLDGFAGLQRLMNASASTLMGAGWAALVWEPLGGRLLVSQIYDHQSNLSQSGVPLLVIDAWEHAYYLQYQNRKDDYFVGLWERFDWKDVARRFDAARHFVLPL